MLIRAGGDPLKEVALLSGYGSFKRFFTSLENMKKEHHQDPLGPDEPPQGDLGDFRASQLLSKEPNLDLPQQTLDIQALAR